MLMPMSGAETPGRESIHASATCAFFCALAARDLRQPIDDGVVGILVVELVGVFVGPGAEGLAFALAAFAAAGEEATSQRTPRDKTDFLREAERNHLALFFTVDEVVVVLHGDEAGETVVSLEVEHLQELPRVHGRCAEVEGLTRADDIIQRVEGLFDGRLGIEKRCI